MPRSTSSGPSPGALLEEEDLPLLSHRVNYGTHSRALIEEEERNIAEVEGVEVDIRKNVDDDDDESRADGSLESAINHQEKRQLGLLSTSLLIFNRIIGNGIFASPSVILHASGSVGLYFVLWLLGAIVAACGTAVFIELGTGIPKNGGEKNYLEFIYRRPRFLTTCAYAMYAIFIGWQSSSSTVFGEYILHAFNPTHTFSTAEIRLAGLFCITFAFLLHGTHLRWGLHLQNALGVFKILVLVMIALSGLGVLARVKGFEIDDPPRNFEWGNMWKGSLNGGANAFVTGLYTTIWSFIGYSNANYALSEIKNPVRTIKLSAPLAMFSITFIYMLVNVAYFAVVDKDEILGSGRIVTALYVGRVWGVGAERMVSVIVAMSTLGNVLAVLFSHGRVIQELGREGILPYSSFFASNKPFNAPLAGLFTQWLVTSLNVLLVPPGDAYLFMVNMSSYPTALINTLVSGGLLLLHSSVLNYNWSPPFRAYTSAIVFFFLSNVFLVVAPLVPPAAGFRPYERLPYWLHVLVASSISLIGVAYWYIRFVWLPRQGGYRLVKERVVSKDDGMDRNVVRRVYDIGLLPHAG